jgi:hypothetical protein
LVILPTSLPRLPWLTILRLRALRLSACGCLLLRHHLLPLNISHQILLRWYNLFAAHKLISNAS